MRSATRVAEIAGPLVVAAWLVGSVPLRYLWARRRLRRSLDRPARPDGGWAGPTGAPVVVWVAEAAVVVGAAAASWRLVELVAPGASAARIEPAIAAFSTQVVPAWQSVALWTAAAAVAGQIGPVWLGFRGGSSGLPGALAAGAWLTPLPFSAALVGYATGLALRWGHTTAHLLGAAGATGAAWMAWVHDVQAGWGVLNGPEASLWVTVMSGMVVARRVATAATPGTDPG